MKLGYSILRFPIKSMLQFEEKRKFRKVLYSKATLCLLFLVLAFIGRATYRVYEKERDSAENLAIVERQYNDLQKRDDNLHADIKRLSSSPGIEKELRDKFRVAKEGEQMAVIVDSQASTESENEPPAMPWYVQLWNWIRN